MAVIAVGDIYRYRACGITVRSCSSERSSSRRSTAIHWRSSSGVSHTCSPWDRGRDQAPATMTGALRAIIGAQCPCPSSAQARASGQHRTWS